MLQPNTVSEITYTPITNIVNNRVVHNDLVKIKKYDSYNDTFKMRNANFPDRTDTLINVSLYNDEVLIDGDWCRILCMGTKTESDTSK